MNESTLRKIQAIAAIGGGVVALHGVTSDAWQRRHTLFVGLGLVASFGILVVTRRRPTPDAAPS